MLYSWIPVYKASHAVNKTMMTADLTSAMDNYARTLTDDDIAALNTGKTTSGLGPVSLRARRQIRAMGVIERAAALIKDLKQEGVTISYESQEAKKIMAINR